MLSLRMRDLTIVAGALVLLLASVAAEAQSADPPEVAYLGGVPAPIAPAVIERDTDGHATVRATRLQTPLQIDGVLNEEVYTTVPSFSGFIQADPNAGAPATERTEGWIFFDEDNVYVVLRCWDTNPKRIVANEMRRDNTNISQNDHVGFSLDTFYDHRNALSFTVNTLGGRMDGQVTDERQWNGDINPIWNPKIGWFDGGWTMEAAVPFKTLRYRSSREQVWGIVIRRENRGKNETSYLTAIPRAKANSGNMMLSSAATLVGIEAPQGSRRLEIKPYAIGSLTTDAVTAQANDGKANGGVDMKYGITQNVTADFTYNTDFAQVEADEQQINLTRFNLFFPEKREFFLENQGTFAFGGGGSVGSSNLADLPVLFYSRRIGLEGAGAIPIQAGGRISGRVGRFNVGVLDIQTDKDDPRGIRATNFSVVRVKRDILRRSSIGAIYTGRSVGALPGGNAVYGVDAALTFFANMNFNAYWAKSQTDTLTADDDSYRAQFDYSGDRYGLQLEQLAVGRNFNPEMGFIRRANINETFGQFRFSPRPRNNKRVRKFSYRTSMIRAEDGAGQLQTQTVDAEFAIEFHNGDRFSIVPSMNREHIPAPFRIASDVVVPVGDYEWQNLRVAYNLGQQRDRSGNLSVERGTFYDGDRTVVGISSGRIKVSPRFSLQPTASMNWVNLSAGSFTTRLIGSRVTYSLTPLTFVSALIQYNSSNRSVSSNVRLRWEYRPGSEVFVVYNDQRDTGTPNTPDLLNRSVVVKINRLFRF